MIVATYGAMSRMYEGIGHVEDGQIGLQLEGEAEQQRRRHRAERRPPPEDHGGQRDVAEARAMSVPKEPTEPTVRYAPPIPAIMPPRMTLRYLVSQHPDADRVGRGRVLAHGADPQPPAGAEQADLDAGISDVGDVQEDGRVEEDRADDRDVAEHGDLDGR